uniref:Uncharacterized protein n=1 Tax=Ixodes ricinus TaxID=34613 RepID=A0A147BE59_IXORI
MRILCLAAQVVHLGAKVVDLFPEVVLLGLQVQDLLVLLSHHLLVTGHLLHRRPVLLEQLSLLLFHLLQLHLQGTLLARQLDAAPLRLILGAQHFFQLALHFLQLHLRTLPCLHGRRFGKLRVFQLVLELPQQGPGRLSVPGPLQPLLGILQQGSGAPEVPAQPPLNLGIPRRGQGTQLPQAPLQLLALPRQGLPLLLLGLQQRLQVAQLLAGGGPCLVHLFLPEGDLPLVLLTLLLQGHLQPQLGLLQQLHLAGQVLQLLLLLPRLPLQLLLATLQLGHLLLSVAAEAELVHLPTQAAEFVVLRVQLRAHGRQLLLQGQLLRVQRFLLALHLLPLRPLLPHTLRRSAQLSVKPALLALQLGVPGHVLLDEQLEVLQLGGQLLGLALPLADCLAPFLQAVQGLRQPLLGGLPCKQLLLQLLLVLLAGLAPSHLRLTHRSLILLLVHGRAANTVVLVREVPIEVGRTQHAALHGLHLQPVLLLLQLATAGLEFPDFLVETQPLRCLGLEHLGGLRGRRLLLAQVRPEVPDLRFEQVVVLPQLRTLLLRLLQFGPELPHLLQGGLELLLGAVHVEHGGNLDKEAPPRPAADLEKPAHIALDTAQGHRLHLPLLVAPACQETPCAGLQPHHFLGQPLIPLSLELGQRACPQKDLAKSQSVAARLHVQVAQEGLHRRPLVPALGRAVRRGQQRVAPPELRILQVLRKALLAQAHRIQHLRPLQLRAHQGHVEVGVVCGAAGPLLQGLHAGHQAVHKV